MSIQRFPPHPTAAGRLCRAAAGLVVALVVAAGLSALGAAPAAARMPSERMGPTGEERVGGARGSESGSGASDMRRGLSALADAAEQMLRMTANAATGEEFLAGPAEQPMMAALWTRLTVGLSDLLQVDTGPAASPGLTDPSRLEATITRMTGSGGEPIAVNERTSAPLLSP